MKKLLLMIATLGYLSAQAQTAEEIVGKYAQALGGLQAFNNVKTLKMSGSITVQGMELPITVQVINGKAVRSDVEVMGTAVISAYKDGKAWKQNEFAGAPDPTDVTEGELADLKAQANISSILMDYKARGHKIELAGKEAVEGIQAYKIKLTQGDTQKATMFYIKADDYLLIKSVANMEMMGQSTDVETYYSDLKEVNGLKFFSTRIQKADGEEFQSVKFDKIEVNAPIDEKIFNKP
ncbi:MAG: hypothetical protein QM781_06830 [Chitinophagaceae bacterium]